MMRPATAATGPVVPSPAAARASAMQCGAHLLAHPLTRPLGALIVLLLINLFAVPGFFHLEVKGGHLRRHGRRGRLPPRAPVFANR